MTIIEKTLKTLEECIAESKYIPVETERIELKNLGGGWGDDWYKTVCAFLNTNGGMIVIGVQDKDNAKPAHYKFTGYTNSQANESHLKYDLPRKFTNKEGQQLDLSTYFPTPEIKDFLTGQVVIVYIEPLSAEHKFVYYNGVAYQRKLTGDHIITKAQLEEYQEIKEEILSNQELALVKDATLDLINIKELNNFIFRFNRGKKSGETLKIDLNDALSFLTRQSFIRENTPTILGLLVCGNELEQYIQGKCEVDCYVKSPVKIAESKLVLQDNIINLIDQSLAFVFRSIKVGIVYTSGGTAAPEYPEELLREMINNALVHRNYNTNRFVIIEITPNEHIMIRNPGAFARRQRLHLDTQLGKIRRIIPIQIARNPKLANLLKNFDRWEGIGKGLASLTDACLENVIDVPYYILMDGEIKLYTPTGKVYDDAMEYWLNSFAGYTQTKYGRALNEEEKIMLSFFYKSERINRLEHYTILLTTDNNHKNVIADLEEKGLLFKNPQSPEIYPIYMVDRVLMKTDFSEELNVILKQDIRLLKQDDIEVLNAIYKNTKFANQETLVNANSIGTFIYLNRYKKITDVKEYENFKQKIRIVFNQLETKKLILRENEKKSNFMINENFVSAESLF
ncbi:MAG: hypothetical protein RLZZ292_1379 [Bacteroidota bacterium]|jgi:predicted HTH transcriptional regulator